MGATTRELDCWHARIDELEAAVFAAGMPLVVQPLTHQFAGDLYIRSVVNPKDSLVTTKIHLTQHPFFVLRGRAVVATPGGMSHEVTAPYAGITEPGTRRVILALEDVLWVTVHAMLPAERDEPDIDKRLAMIEARIVERRELADGKTAHELFWESFQRQQLAAGSTL